MSPSDFSSVLRIQNASPHLLLLVAGGFVLADVVAYWFGTTLFMLMNRAQPDSIPLTIAYGIGLALMTALSWAFIPMASWCWKLGCTIFRLPEMLSFHPLDDRSKTYVVRMSDARRVAIGRNNKTANDAIDRHQADIDKQAMIRRSSAALVVAVLLGAMVPQGLVRSLAELLETHPLSGFVVTLVLSPMMVYICLQAIAAFITFAEDEYMPTYELGNVLELDKQEQPSRR